jgi:YhcH/YjgK/YiaL family protein
MIFGNVKDLESSFAWLPKPLKVAVEHLKNTDFLALPAGNYDLQGKDIYVQVIDLTTKPFAETKPEVHRQYIDVQFLCRGSEKIGVASETGKNAVAEDLLEQRDLLFYTGMENESTLTMTPGSFAVFFPSDVHRPACAFDQPMAIRKVVIKVGVSLLADGV